MPFARSLFRSGTLAVQTLLLAQAAQAQTTYVWNDTTSTWLTPSAWMPTGPDWTQGQRLIDSVASFTSQATILNQPNLTNDIQTAGILINDSQAAWNISGNYSLNIDSKGLSVTGNGPNTSTISTGVFLTDAQTWAIGQNLTVVANNTFSGSGNFTKSGPGKLVLSGTASNTGTTAATGGTLILSGDRSAATGVVTAQNALVKLGDGTILGGNLVISGLAPTGEIKGNNVSFQASQAGTAAPQTNSPNMFGDSEEATVMGSVTMDDDTVIEFDIDGPDPDTGYDRLNVDQGVTIDNAYLYLNQGNYSPYLGETFFLFDDAGTTPVTGQFGNAPEGDLMYLDGDTYQITYNADAASGSLTGGNDIALVTVGVPEPSTALLLLPALLLREQRRGKR